MIFYCPRVEQWKNQIPQWKDHNGGLVPLKTFNTTSVPAIWDLHCWKWFNLERKNVHWEYFDW